MRMVTNYALTVLVFLMPCSVSAIRKYYAEENCDGQISMEGDGIHAGRLILTRHGKYRSRLSCSLTITAPHNRKLILVFRELDIEWEPNCDDDFLQIFDGSNTYAKRVKGLPVRICGSKRPTGSFITSGSHVSIYFHSDIFKQENGFEMIFTAYHHKSGDGCTEQEFECVNGRCIAASLYCDDFNNCGDESDECHFNSEVMFAVVISVLLLTVIGVGGIVAYKKRRKQNTKQIKSMMSPSIFRLHLPTERENVYSNDQWTVQGAATVQDIRTRTETLSVTPDTCNDFGCAECAGSSPAHCRGHVVTTRFSI